MKIESRTLYRTGTIETRKIDVKSRRVDLAFSSEEPVQRFFGSEILDHSKSSVRLGRIRNNGPVLVDHDSRRHVGVIENVSIDNDRIGRASVRFLAQRKRVRIITIVSISSYRVTL